MTSLGVNEQQILNIKRSWMLFLTPLHIIFCPYWILRYKFDEVVLTNQKFHVREGLISKVVVSTPLRKINNVAYEQGIFGRIFGYGTIVIESAATSGMTRYSYIKDPERIKNAIEQAIEKTVSE